MRAPVCYHTIGAIWCVAFPAIANDRVIGNADRCIVNYRQRWVGRFQSPDAVWQTFGTSQLNKFCTGERVFHYCCELPREIDQADRKFTQSAAGHIAPAMW